MSKRRDAGSGTIFPDKARGGYVGRVKIDGKQYVRRGKTKAQVVDLLNALQRDHARGTLATDQRTTVAEMLDRYVERSVPNRRGGNLSPTSIYRYRWAADHVIAKIGTKRVAKLTPDHVEAMLDTLAAEGMARDSITKIRNVLRAALDVALKRGEVARNVAALAELPATTKPERRRSSMSIDMAHRFIACLEDERNGAMFALMARLGLRPGEAAGLYWEDIDLDAATVNITRARKTDQRGRASIGDELKTSTAKRTAHLPADLVSMLARHRKAQAAERLAAATWVDDRLVFATTSGTPLAATSVRRHLAAICRRHDITVDDAETGPRTPMAYELRHTASSMLSAADAPHEVVADLFGLTSTRMIEARYRHRLRPTVTAATDYEWPEADAR